MSKTATELANRALATLKVVGAGQTAQTEDVQLVIGLIAPMLAELSRRKVVEVPDADVIEDEFFIPLAVLLADRAAEDFVAEFDQQRVARAERDLRIMQASEPSEEPVEATYY